MPGDLEKAREYGRAKYYENRLGVLMYTQLIRLAFPDECRETERRYYRKNREDIVKRKIVEVKRYRKENPKRIAKTKRKYIYKKKYGEFHEPMELLFQLEKEIRDAVQG